MKKQNKRPNRKVAQRRFSKYDIVFIFKDVSMLCDLNPDAFSEKDGENVKDALRCASREINIDKTYVQGKNSKFKKAFMTEEGWNFLCEMLFDTEYGKKATKAEQKVMTQAYDLMIEYYMELFFRDLGYDTQNMRFQVKPNSKFTVEYRVDTAKEWKTYPGKWQFWNQPQDDGV